MLKKRKTDYQLQLAAQKAGWTARYLGSSRFKIFIDERIHAFVDARGKYKVFCDNRVIINDSTLHAYAEFTLNALHELDGRIRECIYVQAVEK